MINSLWKYLGRGVVIIAADTNSVARKVVNLSRKDEQQFFWLINCIEGKKINEWINFVIRDQTAEFLFCSDPFFFYG